MFYLPIFIPISIFPFLFITSRHISIHCLFAHFQILTLSLVTLVASRSHNPNIPVESQFGPPTYVNPETLLEAALYPHLRQHGILNIDVDDVDHETAVFEVELYSRNQIGDDFQGILAKVINSDLGLQGVTVKNSPPSLFGNFWRSIFQKKSFYLYFDPRTFVSSLSPLAAKVLATTDLSREDSVWD